MGELLDPDGYWDTAMIEMMLGEALVIETKRKQAAHETALSAIGSAFSKSEAGGAYLKSLQKAMDSVDDSRQRARGTVTAERRDEAVDQLRRDLRGGRKRKK